MSLEKHKSRKELVFFLGEADRASSCQAAVYGWAEAWGIARAGARVESIFSDALNGIGKTTMDESMEFFWRQDQIPSEYAVYRVGEEEDDRRSMDDIPSEEILNALREVLEEQASMTEPDLIRETAKKFGFSRMGNVIENAVGYALKKGIGGGALKVLDNGNITADTY